MRGFKERYCVLIEKCSCPSSHQKSQMVKDLPLLRQGIPSKVCQKSAFNLVYGARLDYGRQTSWQISTIQTEAKGRPHGW